MGKRKEFFSNNCRLIAADTFLLKFSIDMKNWFFLIPILPVVILALSIAGKRDLNRRFHRVLEAIAHLSKLENLLGLDEDISQRLNIFQKDQFLFQRWIQNRIKYASEEEFINGEIKHDNMYTRMRWIYVITFIVGIALIVVPILFLLLPRSVFGLLALNLLI